MNVARYAALAVALSLFGATGSSPSPANGAGISTGYAHFGFALLDQLAGESPSDNVFVSPASVAIALAMAANGAGGSTRAAILKTLSAGDASIAAFDAANASLITDLRNPGSDIQFSVANAMWLNKSIAVEPSFVSVNKDVFHATAETVPMGDPQAAETINAWVKANTMGLIPSIVDSTKAADVAILTNAIAMKAKWYESFKKNATHDAPFHAAGGTQTTVSMMTKSGTIAYADRDGFQVARLPYCCSNRFAMYVFLPHEGTALHAAMKTLDAAEFDATLAALQDRPLLFEMPRYKAEFQATLNEPLEKLGMGVAFSNAADFSNLVAPPGKAAISQVNHRVFVKVDEEGTEAAAATSVAITLMAVHAGPPPTQMIVDRPFLMAIRDDQTKQILFLGAILNPKS